MPTPHDVFPKFPSHDRISCWNCGGDIVGGYYCVTEYPPRRGQFKQACEKCRYNTYYDLEDKNEH